MLERLVRYKPHTLTKGEENLLAMQSEMSGAASTIFRQLTDTDMKFGEVKNEKGEKVELNQSSYQCVPCIRPNGPFARRRSSNFTSSFADHENTLAASLAGSIQKDVYYAKARSYKSALESSLFSDDVPVSVYENLTKAVRSKLPAVHKYLGFAPAQNEAQGYSRAYDTYVPILTDLDKRHTWDQAVKVILAIAPSAWQGVLRDA